MTEEKKQTAIGKISLVKRGMGYGMPRALIPGLDEKRLVRADLTSYTNSPASPLLLMYRTFDGYWTEFERDWQRRAMCDYLDHVDKKTGAPTEAFWGWRKRDLEDKEMDKGNIRKPKEIRAYRTKARRSGKSWYPTSYLGDDGQTLYSYIEAREFIYARNYAALIRQLPLFAELVKVLKSGKNVVLFDLDVPKDGPTLFSEDAYVESMRDLSAAWGHAWTFARELDAASRASLSEPKHKSEPKRTFSSAFEEVKLEEGEPQFKRRRMGDKS